MNNSIKIAIVFGLVVAIIATVALKNKDDAETSEAKVSGVLPRLVDLGADKCIPCKAMAPILEGLKKEYAGVFNVEFIDVWKNPNAGGEYGVKIIPTQIFFDAEGKELFRHEGFFSKEDILAKWKGLDINIKKNQE
jgi:thioredoxin